MKKRFAHFLVTRFNLGAYSRPEGGERYTDSRLWFLEHTFAPTIAAQDDQDFRVLLLCDRKTPREHRLRIRDILEQSGVAERVDVLWTNDTRISTNRGRGSVAVTQSMAAADCEYLISNYYDVDDLLAYNFIRRTKRHAERGIRRFGDRVFAIDYRLRRVFLYDFLSDDLRYGSWPRRLYCSALVEPHSSTPRTTTRRKLHSGFRRTVRVGGLAMLCVTNHDFNVCKRRDRIAQNRIRWRGMKFVTTKQGWTQAVRLFPRLDVLHRSSYRGLVRNSTTTERNGWQLGASASKVLADLLRPGMKTLECGSGLSTHLFAEMGCDHTALEHNAKFAPPLPCVKICPLVGRPKWYDWEPDGPYDVVLVDGPPGSASRRGILRVLDRIAHDKTTFLFDDTNRRRDRALCRRVARRLGLTGVAIPSQDKLDFNKQATLLIKR